MQYRLQTPHLFTIQYLSTSRQYHSYDHRRRQCHKMDNKEVMAMAKVHSKAARITTCSNRSVAL